MVTMMKSSSDWITTMQPGNAFTMVDHHISLKICVLSSSDLNWPAQAASTSAATCLRMPTELSPLTPRVCGFQPTASSTWCTSCRRFGPSNLKTPIEGWMIDGPTGLCRGPLVPSEFEQKLEGGRLSTGKYEYIRHTLAHG